MCHNDHMILYDFIDNTLAPDERARVIMHLNQCPECRQLLNEIKLMSYELEHLPPVEVPTELESVRMKAIQSALPKQRVTLLRKVQQSPLLDKIIEINPGKRIGRTMLWTGKQLLNKKKKKPLLPLRRLL